MGHWLQPLVEVWKNTSQVALLGLVITALSLGVGSLQTIFAYLGIAKPKRDAPEDSSALLDPVLRLGLLKRIRAARVDPRLDQGLRRAIRIDLGLTETPGDILGGLRVYARLESGAVAERPISGSIQDIFEHTADGQLLILGEPGTGKTNLLLELAQSLIAAAAHDETRPIPVVLSLPRWARKPGRTLAEWLKEELAFGGEYDLLPPAVADALVRQDRILPLLDALDEVSEDRRTACLDAIHAYQRDRNRGNLGELAVCCRIEEYAGIPNLDLGTAVRVGKLTREDIERAIANPKLSHVREALERDPQLWDLVDSPLMLHVLYLYGAPLGTLSHVTQRADRRDWLWAQYVEYALGRETKDSPRSRTAREPLLHWLGWLAAEMRRRGQTQFVFEELDFSWLAPQTEASARMFVLLAGWLPFGLIGVSLRALLGGGRGALLEGALAGLVFGVLLIGKGASGVRERIEAVEELDFVWPGFGSKLAWALLAGSGFGLLLGLFGALEVSRMGALLPWLIIALFVGLFALRKPLKSWLDGSLRRRVIVWLLVGLFCALLDWRIGGLGALIGCLAFGLFLGLAASLMNWLADLQQRVVSAGSTPNRGTLRSLRYAVGIALPGLALFLSLAFALQVEGSVQSPLFSYFGVIFLLLAMLYAQIGFRKGGLFALRHYSIRLFLWWLGHVPLRYVRFLKEAEERLFLIRLGGGYEFFHSTFRDYMADTYGPPTPPVDQDGP